MKLRQNIRRVLVAKCDCSFDFLTMGGAIKAPTAHSLETRERVKNHLRITGWAYRAAAKQVGCHFHYVDKVLNGVVFSNPMVEKLLALPPCPTPNCNAGIKPERATSRIPRRHRELIGGTR